MDPDTTLAIARAASARILEADALYDLTPDRALEMVRDAVALAEAFDSLNGWLSDRGYVPSAWRAAPHSPPSPVEPHMSPIIPLRWS